MVSLLSPNHVFSNAYYMLAQENLALISTYKVLVLLFLFQVYFPSSQLLSIYIIISIQNKKSIYYFIILSSQ